MNSAPDKPSPGDDVHPTANERADHGRRWVGWCVAVVALPILYVLSAGPAVWITARFDVNPDWLEYVYAPVTWLNENTPLRAPFSWYLKFWIPESFYVS